MKNKNYNGHCDQCGETFSSCRCYKFPDLTQINFNFERTVMCDCLRPGCKHCDPLGDRESGFHFDLPEEELFYFLEDQLTGRWLSTSDTLTSNPHEALSFRSRVEAHTYLRNKQYHELVVTEHLFL